MGEGGRVSREIWRGTRKLLGGDEYVPYLDCGDNVTCAHVSEYINFICTFLKHMQFIIGQLYLNNAVFKERVLTITRR